MREAGRPSSSLSRRKIETWGLYACAVSDETTTGNERPFWGRAAAPGGGRVVLGVGRERSFAVAQDRLSLAQEPRPVERRGRHADAAAVRRAAAARQGAPDLHPLLEEGLAVDAEALLGADQPGGGLERVVAEVDERAVAVDRDRFDALCHLHL